MRSLPCAHASGQNICSRIGAGYRASAEAHGGFRCLVITATGESCASGGEDGHEKLELVSTTLHKSAMRCAPPGFEERGEQ
jgi:hypothetical protein